MARRDIGKEIIRGLEEIKAWKKGEVKLKTFTVDFPRAADVPAIRKKLGLSQARFAGFMGVSVATLRSWEQARREPHRPVRSLLLVGAKQPQAVRKAFEAAVPAAKTKAYARSAIPAARAKSA